MSILIDETTPIIVQGITGDKGTFHAKEMLEYGTNVVGVPTSAKTVDLVTSADGVDQSLSLLDGKPGAGNIAVLARPNRFGTITPPAGFTMTESGGGASASRPICM